MKQIVDYINSWFGTNNLDSIRSQQTDFVGPVEYNVTYSEIRQTGRFPSFYHYFELLASICIPFIGPIWMVINGCIWLNGKEIKYLGEMDRSFDMGGEKRKVETIKGSFERPKATSPKEDTTRYTIHAMAFILVGLLEFALHCYVFLF